MTSNIKEISAGEFAIEGELNMQTVPAVSAELENLFAKNGCDNINFDLASVTRSDSAGVALLVELMQRARQANVQLSFKHLPQQMQDISSVSGLTSILPITE